jgi:hypothetical protein
MKRRNFRIPSASMIVACLALIMAIGGSAYAASKITSKNIENGTIKAKDVKDDTLGGKQIKEGKLTGVDAATLQGQTPDQLRSGIDAATLGGESADDQKVRWFLLDETGAIAEQSGGFTVIDAYVTNNNVYIDSGEDLSDNGLSATIAIQNQVDVNGMVGADPDFAGEVSVARCQVPGVVECAPDGAKNVNALVVSPRNSDGSATTATSRERVYVTVTE